MGDRPNARVYGALGLMVVVWGFAFLLMKIATQEAAPGFVAGARAAIAAGAAGLAVLLLGRSRLPPRALWPWCALIGFLGVSAPFAFLTWAAPRLPSGVVGVYMAAVPLFVLPLAHFLSPVFGLGERMTAAKALGVTIGAAGVAVLFGPQRFADLGRADALASAACLAAALCLAMSAVAIRALPETRGRADPVGVAFLQLAFGAAFLAPLAIPAAPSAGLSIETWAVLLALGIAVTALPTALRVYVITNAGAVFMSTAGYLVPITALVVGWSLGGERFAPREILGAVTILIGVGIAQNAHRRLARAFRA